MHITYEPVAPNSLPPVMLVNTQGAARFGTAEARRLCEQWNEGLPEADEADGKSFRLPTGLDTLLRTALYEGWDLSKTGLYVRHPRIGGLAVTIQVASATAGIRDQAWCLLTFASEGAVSSASRSGAEQTLQQLSPGERRVAVLVAEGLRNEQVAQRLRRSRRTVEYQLSAIFRKLDLTNRSQLVRALVQLNPTAPPRVAS